MKLTPLDIHHKEFHRAIRGYSEEEVDKFLDEIAEEFERLFKENIELKEQVEKIKQDLAGYSGMEKTLHNTLLTAQKSAEDVLGHARKESELVLRDSELKAKEIIQEAYDLKGRYESTLGHLKQAEQEFRSKFKSMLESYLRIADSTAVLAEIGADLTTEDQPSMGFESVLEDRLVGNNELVLQSIEPELPKIEMVEMVAMVEEAESPVHASFIGETFTPDSFTPEAVKINLATGTNDYTGASEYNTTHLDFGKNENEEDEESKPDKFDLDNMAF